MNNEINPSIISGAYVRMTTLADGTPRVVIDLDCGLEMAGRMFAEPGVMVAMARLTQEAAKASAQHVTRGTSDKLFGQQAKVLRLSGFFRVPEVWRALGTDTQFREWVQRQPSAFSGQFSEYVNSEGRCIAAHVRRIADGAGTSIKPEYACIPLTDEEHKRQHQHGEGVLGSSEWWDKQRIKCVEAWAWQALKWTLHAESMADIEPKTIRAWAEFHGIDHHLPQEYRA